LPMLEHRQLPSYLLGPSRARVTVTGTFLPKIFSFDSVIVFESDLQCHV
jgi:hypothetical protein